MSAKKDIRVYPALLSEEGQYVNVRFPDLPGCNTFGEGYADAVASALMVLGEAAGRALAGRLGVEVLFLTEADRTPA